MLKNLNGKDNFVSKRFFIVDENLLKNNRNIRQLLLKNLDSTQETYILKLQKVEGERKDFVRDIGIYGENGFGEQEPSSTGGSDSFIFNFNSNDYKSITKLFEDLCTIYRIEGKRNVEKLIASEKVSEDLKKC